MAPEPVCTQFKANRKANLKQALSFVPELERTVSHDFKVALVGIGARHFATRLCESDFARAHRPSLESSATPVAGLDASHADFGLEEQTPPPLFKASSIGSKPPVAEVHADDPFVLYCPVGGSEQLARVRFEPIEEFSDPLPGGANDAATEAVAFLLWRIRDDGTDTSRSDKVIGELTSRMSEAEYTSALRRPYTAVLAFEAEDAQVHKLQTFVDNRSGADVKLHMYTDDEEDTVSKAMQAFVDEMVEFQSQALWDAKRHEPNKDAADLDKDASILIDSGRRRWADMMDDEAETDDEIVLEPKVQEEQWWSKQWGHGYGTQMQHDGANGICEHWCGDSGMYDHAVGYYEQPMCSVMIQGLPPDVCDERYVDSLLDYLGMKTSLVCYEAWSEAGNGQMTLTYANWHMGAQCSMYFQRCLWANPFSDSLTVNIVDLNTGVCMGFLPQTYDSSEYQQTPGPLAASAEDHVKARLQAYANALAIAAGRGPVSTSSESGASSPAA